MTGSSNFERAALPHMDAAYNLAYWLVRSRSDAEDIVQDAYLRAFRAYGSLTGEDIRPWLLTIVRHCAYRWLTKRKHAGNVVSFDEAFPGRSGDRAGEANIVDAAASAEALLVGASERAMVTAALELLPPAYREVIVLREMEEMTYREIAEVTGVPIGTVMSRLSRGRAEMKKIVTDLIEKDELNAV